jgi:hypothetical protein
MSQLLLMNKSLWRAKSIMIRKSSLALSPVPQKQVLTYVAYNYQSLFRSNIFKLGSSNYPYARVNPFVTRYKVIKI